MALISFVTAILVVWLSEKKKKWSNLFLLVFAIAGGQSLLQRWGEK
jgi:ABC-type transport system involved in cytochrome c biogenesis permease subunit